MPSLALRWRSGTGGWHGIRPTVRLLRVRRDEPVFLSHFEVDRLAEAAGNYCGLIRVLAYTGLRWDVAESETEIQDALSWGTPKDDQRRSVPFRARSGPAMQL